MSFWTYDNLREVTAGRWLQRPIEDAAAPEIAGLSTDTRSLRRGQVFCALRGERFDAHDYLNEAAAAGAALLIVDREDVVETLDAPDTPVLLVGNCIKALARLAAAYRRTLNARVIAITGSAGKTTAKVMLQAVLGPHFAGSASPKSFNNHIGVPLTLLNVNPGDAYVVVEVGTNAPGEIAALSRIVAPDIAIITHVGAAHLEGLQDVESVAREKAALLTHLRDGGLAIVNGDLDVLEAYLKVVEHVITFGRSTECDLRLTGYDWRDDRAAIEVNGRARFELPLLGVHNAINALAAVAVGRHMKLTDEQIDAGLRTVQPPEMRLGIERYGSDDEAVVVINDAYNANPDSMAAAVEVLRSHPAAGDARRVAVLGDMLELGPDAPQWHRRVGEQVVAADLDSVVFIGKLSMYAAETALKRWDESRVRAMAAWTDETAEEVAGLIEPGDVVMIKASRAMGLERIAAAIQRRFS